MPRKPREFVAGGIYHVFNRGNNRQTLFGLALEFEALQQLKYFERYIRQMLPLAATHFGEIARQFPAPRAFFYLWGQDEM